MLGCAIVDGLLARKNTFLRIQSFARKWNIENLNHESSLIKGKFSESNGRHYGTTIIRGIGGSRVGFTTSLPTGKTPSIQTRGISQPNKKPYDIETNITKDLIIFKYENPRYFRLLNAFAFTQLIFWTYLAHFVYVTLKDTPILYTENDDLPWWRRINLGDRTYRTILTVATFLVGYSIFCLCWMNTLKSVRYLILRKGGNDITFVTYTPFGGNRIRTVSLDHVTCKQSRAASPIQLPIKIKGDILHYLIDMRGQFKHPELFDFTAGLRR